MVVSFVDFLPTDYADEESIKQPHQYKSHNSHCVKTIWMLLRTFPSILIRNICTPSHPRKPQSTEHQWRLMHGLEHRIWNFNLNHQWSGGIFACNINKAMQSVQCAKAKPSSQLVVKQQSPSPDSPKIIMQKDLVFFFHCFPFSWSWSISNDQDTIDGHISICLYNHRVLSGLHLQYQNTFDKVIGFHSLNCSVHPHQDYANHFYLQRNHLLKVFHMKRWILLICTRCSSEVKWGMF